MSECEILASMPAALEEPRRAGATRRSWGAVADVVGHCVIVFAFVPPLAAVARWLYAEAHNPLNLHDAIVLAFLPARGLLAFLDAFSARIERGVLAGAVAGVLLSALFARRIETARQRLALGALSGLLGGCAALVALAAPRFLHGAHAAPPGDQVGFELVAGMLCGMIATPSAYRFITHRRCALLTPDRKESP